MPLKIYADFEHNVKGVMCNDSDNASHNEKYQAHILCIFAYKVVCVHNKFSKPVALYRGKMQFIDLLKLFLKSIIVPKKWSKSIIIRI